MSKQNFIDKIRVSKIVYGVNRTKLDTGEKRKWNSMELKWNSNNDDFFAVLTNTQSHVILITSFLTRRDKDYVA